MVIIVSLKRLKEYKNLMKEPFDIKIITVFPTEEGGFETDQITVDIPQKHYERLENYVESAKYTDNE